MRIILYLCLVLTLGFTATSCSSKISDFELFLDDGNLWHDLVITNRTGKDLHQINIVATLTGTKGEQGAETKQYSIWGNGDTARISFSVKHSPPKVAEVSVKGTCQEGLIDLTWTPPNKSK